MRNKGVILGVAVSVGIILAIALSVDLAEVGRQLRQVRLRYFFPMAAIILLGLIIRTYRWELLLPSSEVATEVTNSFSYRVRLFEALIVGFFANAVLPLRAGEFIRAFVVDRWCGIRFPVAFASIVLERVFDVVALLIFLWWVTQSLENVPPVFLFGAQALGLLACAIVAFVVAAYVSSSLAIRWVKAVGERFLPQQISTALTKFISEFVAGLQVLRSSRQLFGALFLSLTLWLVIAVFYQVSVYLFAVDADFHTGMLVSIAIALAVAAPSGPGFVGTYQAGCLLALVTILGRPEEFAVAYSIVTHLFQTVLLTVLGLFVVNRRGLILGELLKKHEAI